MLASGNFPFKLPLVFVERNYIHIENQWCAIDRKVDSPYASTFEKAFSSVLWRDRLRGKKGRDICWLRIRDGSKINGKNNRLAILLKIDDLNRRNLKLSAKCIISDIFVPLEAMSFFR